MTTPETEDVPITGGSIRLGQLLKLTGIAEDGASARILLADEAVQVNGMVETRRGRQLQVGDVLYIDLPPGPIGLRIAHAS